MCIHRYKVLARFGLMHMAATNICVWFRSIVVETLHEIHHHHVAHDDLHPASGHATDHVIDHAIDHASTEETVAQHGNAGESYSDIKNLTVSLGRKLLAGNGCSLNFRFALL